MATLTDHSLSPPLFFGDGDDEDIIEVGSIRTTGGRQPSLAEILRPSASAATRQQRTHRHGSRPAFARRSHPADMGRNTPVNRRPQGADHLAQTQFIDLTGEDTPAAARSSTSHRINNGPLPLPLPLPLSQLPPENQSQTSQSSTGRNPRRTNSQRISPPSLERSDSHTFMASHGNVIDLTEDSPESPESDRQRAARRNDGGLPLPDQGLRTGRAFQTEPSRDELWGLDIRTSGWVAPLRSLRDFLGTAAGFQPPRLDVSRNPFSMANNQPHHHEHRRHHHNSHHHHHHHHHHAAAAANYAADLHMSFAQHGIPIPQGIVREPSPKPPMEPIPDTRPGFTRDTQAPPEEGEEDQGSGEKVIICPACEEELAYDPADAETTNTSPASKKRKRAAGEHHFWALKRCGHVYCADCFENRRPTKTKPTGSGFHTTRGVRAVFGETGGTDVRCAVDGCDTKAHNKGEWLGIFL